MEQLEGATTVERMILDQAKRTRTPANGSIELLPLCNMNCDMCYVRLSREEMERQGRLRTADEWLEIGRQMKEAGVWIEITNLVIPSVNDTHGQIRTLCRWLADNGLADSPLHFSRFFPRYRLGHLPPTPVETLLQARQTAREEGMRFVYIGNTNPPGAEDTCCPHCGKRLVRRDIYQVSPHRFSGCCPDCGQPIPGVWT